tara:strand:- start:18 stop:374 length:357 start_codon:yes stop_codon:yes gene_type:complete
MQYVVGDRPLLKVTFKEDGSPIDLSPGVDTYTAYIRTSLNGETAVETTMSEAYNGADPDAGIATFRFPASGAGAIDEQGVLEFEFFLKDSAAKSTDNVTGTAVYTSQKFRRKVRAKVG